MRFKTHHLTAALSSAALGGLALQASGIGPQVIYTKIPTSPTSIIPGALDLAGAPAVTNFRALETIRLSPDGSTWLISARTQQGPDLETILLIGSGTAGTMFMQEGQPVPGAPAGELIDFFGSGVGKFNDTNQFALSLRARGGASASFQKVITYTGDLTPVPADFSLVARGGNTPGVDLYTGLVDIPANPTGDETIGNSIGSIHLLNNGAIGAQDSTINLISALRRPAIFYSQASPAPGLVTFNGFKQTGVSTFLGLDGITVHTYGNLLANTFYTTPDNSRYLVQGTISGAPTTSDSVLVVDGQVEIQEGSVVGTSTAVVFSIVNTDLASSGDWYSRGLRSVAGVSNGVWASRNGELIAQTGDPVSTPLTGPAENWANTFLAFSGNSNGDWALVGKTDNPNTAIDDVVVYNGQVVLREGDPIDVDSNGQFDDNAFVGRGVNTIAAFEADDVVVTDDGVLYIFIDLRDGQGNDWNTVPAFGTPQAFVRLDVTPEVDCPADIAPAGGDGNVNVADLLAVVGAWGACADPNNCPADIAPAGGDDIVNVADLLAVVGAWGACPAAVK